MHNKLLNLPLLLMLSLVLVFSGCASVPTSDIKVEAEADPKANFKGYKSYGWLGAGAVLNDPQGQWKPPSFDAAAEVRFLVDRELRARGLSESANPDMMVAFAAGVDMAALKLKSDPKTKIEALENVPQGALVLALVDSASGFVIWVGTATADVQTAADEKTAKARLDYAVTHLVTQIPR